MVRGKGTQAGTLAMTDSFEDGRSSRTDYDPVEQFWTRRPTTARAFRDPEQLAAAAEEAFTWIHTHPKRKQMVFHNKGMITKTYATLERPFTFHLLAMVMGLSYQGLDGYRQRPEFAEVMAWIDNVIYTQKFEGAATGTLNANFIARDLGMAERNELTGRDGGPLQTEDVADLEKLYDEARRLGIDIEALGLGGGAKETPSA